MVYDFFNNPTNIILLFSTNQPATQNTGTLLFRPLASNPSKNIPNPPDNGVCYGILKAGATIVKNILRDNGLHQSNESEKATLFWSNGSLKFNIFKQLGPGQKYNHFP